MKKRLLSLVLCLVALMAVVVPISAASAPETYVDMSSTVTSVRALFGDFSVSNVLIIIGAMVGATLALVLAWWAFRWLYAKVMGAFKRGRA